MKRMHSTIKTVVLGLTMTPLGSSAVLEAAVAPQGHLLAGMVAASYGNTLTANGAMRIPSDGILSSAASGIGVDVGLDLSWAGPFGNPLDMPQYANAAVTNLGDSDASGVYLLLSTVGPADIVSAPGCQADASGAWYCDIGTMPPNTTWSTFATLHALPGVDTGSYVLHGDAVAGQDVNSSNNAADLSGYFEDAIDHIFGSNFGS